MNINSSIHNLRYTPSQNLEKNIVEDIKDEVIEDIQTQPLQESTVEQCYGNASSQQYLANMGIKIVSTSRIPAQSKVQSPENSVTEKQVESNTTQIASSRSAEVKDNVGIFPKTEVKLVNSVPHIPAATVATAVSNSESIGEELYAATGELINEIASYKASGGVLSPEVAANYEELVKKIINDPASIKQMGVDYALEWAETHDLNKYATNTEMIQAFTEDFLSEEFGLGFANIAKSIGGAAITSVLLKIAVSTVIDVAPDMGKDVFKLGKKTFKNLFKLNIGGLIKNTMIDAPVLVIRNAGRSIKALAKNTYQTARDIVVAGVSGVYGTVKAAVKGTVETISRPIKAVAGAASNVLSGVGNGLKKLANGNVIGAVGSVVGGVAKGVGTAVTGAVKTVGSAVKTVAKTVGKAAEAVGNVAEAVFGNPIKAVGNAVKSVGKAIGKLFKGW